MRRSAHTQSAPIHPNPPWQSTSIHPNPPQSAPIHFIHPNPLQSTPFHPNPPQSAPIHLNPPQSAPIRPNPPQSPIHPTPWPGLSPSIMMMKMRRLGLGRRAAEARCRLMISSCCLLLQDPGLYESCARGGSEERERVLWDATSHGLCLWSLEGELSPLSR